jgi:hypothetical protein
MKKYEIKFKTGSQVRLEGSRVILFNDSSVSSTVPMIDDAIYLNASIVQSIVEIKK